MKFIVSSGSLLKQLQLIAGVVSSNTVLPILEDFLFDIKDGKLTVFSTDLETSMSSSLDVEANEEGKIAIPAKLLMDILKTLPEQPLTFSINDQNLAIEITSDKGKYRLTGENGDDFPRIPVPEETKEIKLPSSVIANAINKTLFAVGSDDMRPAMTGVNFELTPDGITFVATDAHRLVRYKRLDAKAGKATSFIVPKKALQLLGNALPAEETQVKISYNSSNAFFNFGYVKLICRLIDARYPDYTAVIPTENPNKLTIQSSDLLSSLRRLVVLSSKTTHQATLKMSGSELSINTRDLDFSNEGNETLTCQYDGEDLEIAFNAKFVIDMIASMNEEEVQFEFSTPSRACIMTPVNKKENEDLLMLVMPIMVNT
ncbi:MAG: DNA polymerase III subunit beta [Chitinophagaceae bacterium]|nr:DNA polymerase III subunit beta [Chitinophagaceae bacterium]